jgi:hypothetical protein
LKQDGQAGQILPWEKAEDTAIDIRLTFEPAKYSPYFLPLPLAYGKKMTRKELLEFLSNPDKDAWKGFTLRLRPGLKPGSILADERTIGAESKPEFRALEDMFAPPADPKKGAGLERPNVDQKLIKETLGESSTDFLVPKDAGEVIDDNGKVMPYAEVQKLLPRLDSVVLRLHVVRVGQLDEWTIFHFNFHDAVLTNDDGTRTFNLHLEHG